ncbi:NlpC/P60 family protein [Kitasatospora griseola]|uniref:NlpC/P60 family protein n=1 Tax=Kitasatospora griseola TaxID=2064 RepID=UPI00342B9002
MKKLAAAVGGGILLAPFIVVLPFAALAGNAAACPAADSQAVDTAAVEAAVKLILDGGSGPTAPVEGLDLPTTQIPMAKAIVATGIALQVPARGQVIALATAMQESRLRNLSYGDRDSLGLFQQRPSQGWGTPEQLTDPVYASTAFYKELLKVSGWQDLPLTVAAQAVQRSGYPDAYAQWEPLATALQQAIVKTLGPSPGATSPAATSPGSCTPPGTDTDWGVIPAGALPAGYQVPTDAPPAVQSAIRWALGQLNTPYQWGGSCTNSHGPDPMGRCDCSSLMQQAYKAGGVATLDRVTYDQVRQGSAVQVADVRAGDLLFTTPGPSGPEHVGMYIGSGLVVHAPHTGDVVRIAQFSSWKSGVTAIRRIVP